MQELGRRPDLIIADYHLDDGDLGTGAIDAVRSVHGGEVPAVVITADRSPNVQEELAERDLALLTKPVKPAQLRAMIRHLVPQA